MGLSVAALKLLIETSVKDSLKVILQETLVEIVRISVSTALEKQKGTIRELSSLRVEINDLRKLIKEGLENAGGSSLIEESYAPQQRQAPQKKQGAPKKPGSGLVIGSLNLLEGIDPQKASQNTAWAARCPVKKSIEAEELGSSNPQYNNHAASYGQQKPSEADLADLF